MKTSIVFCSILLMAAAICIGDVEKPAKTEVQQSAAVGPEPTKAETTTLARTDGNIAHISDIHFNPFYDTSLCAQLIAEDATEWESIFRTSKITGYGSLNSSETNFNLLVSSLENLAETANQPDFIIFTGDFIAHDFQAKFKENSDPGDNYDQFVAKVFTFIAGQFIKYFPDTPVYFSLGNNDSYSGDYAIQAGGAFLKDTTDILAPWFKDDANKKAFEATYPAGGYFKIDPPGSDNTVIISLNTIFFSPKYPGGDEPALKELAWFEEQLKEARIGGRKVWLLLHIPPGANVYGTVKYNTYSSMWVDAFNTGFMQLLKAYASEISAGYCGHTHMDDFRLLISRGVKPKPLAFIRISPAISPQFGNNPGFQRIVYNPGAFTLTDSTFYFLNLTIADPSTAQWGKEYSFGATYNQSRITAATLLSVYNAMRSDAETRQAYMTYYNVSDTTSPAITEANFKAYWCGIGAWTAVEYEACNKMED